MSSMNAFAHDSSSESSEDEYDFLHPSADPNADEFADYNPRKRRRTGRDAKESAALGVFGSESEGDGPGKRWKKKNLRGKGMAFVSKGQKQDDDDNEDEEDGAFVADGEDDVDMEDAEDEEEVPGLGLGFKGAKGLGFQSPAPRAMAGSKSNTPLGKGFVPSSANIPILIESDNDEKSTPRIARPSAFSTPNSHHAGRHAEATPKVNAGSFAARMMAKMGYKEGQGLGKEGQGRSGVIEVQLRPQGVGLGAVAEKSRQEKEEERRQAKFKGEKYGESDEEQRRRRKTKLKIGVDTRSGTSTPKKAPKPKYRTVEELQKEAPGLHIPEAFAPILDMTGPGQRLLTSTSGLLTPTAGALIEATEDSVAQKESRKLARRAQNDLSSFVEEWKNLEGRKAYVEMEMTQLKRDIDEEQREYDLMTSFSDTVQGISQAVDDGQWDPVIEALTVAEGLQISGANEELSNIAVAAVHPFLNRATEGWQPLDDPKLDGMAPALFKIRRILGASQDEALSRNGFNSHSSRGKSTTCYESMIYKIIFPKIVSAINRTWDVYNASPVLALLDTWEDLLPAFVRSQIVDLTVVGKLNEAVSLWNPKKRRHNELPHLWLFPWLQYLPAHHADPKSSTGLVSDIKRKFRHLIDSWDFHKGVIPGLQQWREVLYRSSNSDHWTPLIMNHVLPNMARFLKNEKNFQVDPNDQAPFMSALEGIFAWKDILIPRIIGQVITETVFPMWHNVLHQWLTVVGPNQEIGQWFEWWRDEVFPEEIKSLDSIQEEFSKGHTMIDQALDLGSKAKTHLPAPSSRPEHVKSPESTPITLKIPAPVEQSSFRDNVEDWCIENDLQFLPEKKTLHSAGPLFRITAAANGKLGTLVYFKGDSITAVTRKGGEMVDVKIDWENAESRDVLLGMAWYNVK
ncbi:hypothetical protein B7494_g5355 [Chlorociboria aeruginascens]|nr:hypothetical protein B7494_g5355 [Chlorociboria aeruginascens]